MFTHSYKGLYIHGYFNRDECTVTDDKGIVYERCRSYRAAQRYISKKIKN